jgi:hypothetical protein
MAAPEVTVDNIALLRHTHPQKVNFQPHDPHFSPFDS